MHGKTTISEGTCPLCRMSVWMHARMNRTEAHVCYVCTRVCARCLDICWYLCPCVLHVCGVRISGVSWGVCSQ